MHRLHQKYSDRPLHFSPPLQPSPPSPPPENFMDTRLDSTLSAAFATAFLVTVAYLVLSSIHNCLRRCRARIPAGETANAQKDPVCWAQLQAIPVTVYAGPPPSPPPQPPPEASGSAGELCPVCLAEYAAGEEARVLPRCGHMFHRACIDEWLLARSSFCPVCRNRVIARAVEPSENGYHSGISARLPVSLNPHLSSVL